MAPPAPPSTAALAAAAAFSAQQAGNASLLSTDSHQGSTMSPMDDSGGSGGGNDYGDPELIVSGGAIIGGPVDAEVWAPGGMEIMTSVTWTVTGAMKSQTYQNSSGTTTPLSGSVTDTWGGGGVSYDAFDCYWNATPGNHTVTVSVTYDDGTTGSASQTINVAQPTVNSFNVVYGPTLWVGGQAQPQPSSGIGYLSGMDLNASVSVPPGTGGQINVIQSISIPNSEINKMKGGGQATYTMVTPHVVLDNDPNMTQPTDPGYVEQDWGASVDANGTATLPDTAFDSPHLGWIWDSNTGVGTLDLRMDATFKDYLVYQAPGGIWVQIGETPSYTESGEEKWVGPFDTGHWATAAAPSPAQETTLQGNNSLGFVEWNDYLANRYNQWDSTLD